MVADLGAAAPEPLKPPACFFEVPGVRTLAQRAFAEGTGALLLTAVVVTVVTDVRGQLGVTGPLAALGPGLVGAATLSALIVAFGPASGGHFNPMITASQWLRAERNGRCVIAYVAAQFGGAWAGATLVCLLMPAAGHLTASVGGAPLGEEVLASFGLMTIVLSVGAAAPPGVGPFAVGGWIAMVNIALPGGALANPILVLALWLSEGAGLARTPQAIEQVLAEVTGCVVAYGVAQIIYPPAHHFFSRSAARRSNGRRDAPAVRNK